jgi:uncharacterized membrane-anchored protein
VAASVVHRSAARELLNKVPEITIWFWIIKVLATTVGETAADFLSDTLNLGLTNTIDITAVLLVVALAFQMRSRRYVPALYWTTVVLISIAGTLITDKLVDDLGVALETTVIGFAIALAATFAVWFASERTLSIHSILTPRREAFYWSAILFTFALGTAAGDDIAEHLDLGYWRSAILFAGAIAVVAALWRAKAVGPVLGFWMAYVLTRPLGASLGDYVSQKRADGGLGLGTVGTSAVFIATILGVVVYLTRSGADQAPGPVEAAGGR